MQLPSRLEERLKKLFSRAKDRETFVMDAVVRAIEELERTDQNGMPEAVGGTLHLYTDGGSRGNPGEAAIGCVLMDPLTGKILKEHKETIGIQTNNVAEYRALIRGLEITKHFQPNRLVCHLDSELIVKQLSGAYRVKMPTLQPLIEEIQELTAEFHEVSFSHIPREENRRADRLVNEALDGLR
ncbi:MAG TPA: ribonuclease HI family protein [Candidatus Peribacterales bacterium]|nr:ribonuclease HI family protein [Candidatus Peribacterales bacterium]